MIAPNGYDFAIIGAIVLVVGTLALKPAKGFLAWLWARIKHNPTPSPNPAPTPAGDEVAGLHEAIDHYLALRSLPIVASNQDAVKALEFVGTLLIVSAGRDALTPQAAGRGQQ